MASETAGVPGIVARHVAEEYLVSDDDLIIAWCVALMVITFGGGGTAVVVRWWRGRRPDSGMRTAARDGVPATVLRPIRPVQVSAAMTTLYGLLFLASAWALVARSGSGFFAVVFAVGGLWFLGSGVYQHSGGYDESLWLTRDQVIQRDRGAEQAIRWADVVGTSRLVGGVGLVTKVEPDFRRISPHVLYRGPAAVTHLKDEAGKDLSEYVFPVAMDGLHPNIYKVGALYDWLEHPELRLELGTDMAVRRLLHRDPVQQSG